MGTNYYSVKRDIEHLVMMDFYDLHERCYDLDGNDVLHIGKSSSGWCFSLHVIPEQGINSLQDWVKLFIDPERMIVDEYKNECDLIKIMGVITTRSRQNPDQWSQEEMDRNCAEPGPNNLVRHRLGRGCTAHGEGTWDLLEGHFS